MVLAVWPAKARADAPREALTLEWNAPAGCPDEKAAGAVIRARLPDQRGISVRGEVKRVDRTYRLTLRIGDGGERVLEGTDCKDLVSSAAVVVAMAVASQRAAEEPRGETALPAPKPAPPPEPIAPPPTPPPRAAPQSPIFGFAVRAEGIVDVGSLPGIAFGPGLAFAIEPQRAAPWLRAEIFAMAAWSRDSTFDADRTRGASFMELGVGGRLCARTLPATVDLLGCAGGELSSIVASGFGAVRSNDATSRVVVTRADVAVGVRIVPALTIRVGAGVLWAPAPESFAFVPLGTLHERSALAGRMFLGPELSF